MVTTQKYLLGQWDGLADKGSYCLVFPPKFSISPEYSPTIITRTCLMKSPPNHIISLVKGLERNEHHALSQFYQEHNIQSARGRHEVTEEISIDNHDFYWSHRKRQHTPVQEGKEGPHICLPFKAQRLTSLGRVNNGTANWSLKEKERCTTNRSESFFSAVSLTGSLFSTFLWR